MATTLARMQQRRDTTTGWEATNPVLLPGEVGYDTDTDKLKVGNGVSAWAELPWSLLTYEDVVAAFSEQPSRLTSAGGGYQLWGDAFERSDRPLTGPGVSEKAPVGGFYSQQGKFNTQNLAPKIVNHRFVIDTPGTPVSSWWAFLLMRHTTKFETVAAEFGFTAITGQTAGTQECVLVASSVKPTLSNLSVQFAVDTHGFIAFTIMGGRRNGVGSIGYLSATLNPSGGPITSIPVTGGTFGGSTRGITQAVPAGTITLVSNDGAHHQTWTTPGAAVGATAIPVTSQTPDYGYSGDAPVAYVIIGSAVVLSSGTHPTVLPEDDTTRHQATMRLDEDTDSIIATIDGRVVGTWTDPNLVDFWGLQAAVQLLQGASTGSVWAKAVATYGPEPVLPAPPSAAVLPYLTGDTGTYFSTRAPAWSVDTLGGLVVGAWIAPEKWQSGATQVVISQWGTHDNLCWLGTPASGGKKLEAGLSVDGENTVSVLSTVAHTFLDGQAALIALAYDPNPAVTANVRFYTSTSPGDARKAVDNSDGGTWTQLGSAVTSGVTGPLWSASAQRWRVGSRNSVSTLPFTGYVYDAFAREGVTGDLLVALPPIGGVGADEVGNIWERTGVGVNYRIPGTSVVGVEAGPGFCSTLGNNPATARAGTVTTGAAANANDSIASPIIPDRLITVTKLVWFPTTQSGNYDIGIYDEAGAALWRKGSAAVPAAGAAILTGITGVVLQRGTRYWVRLALDNTTARFRALALATAAEAQQLDGEHYARTTAAFSMFPLPSSQAIPTSASLTVPFVVVRAD